MTTATLTAPETLPETASSSAPAAGPWREEPILPRVARGEADAMAACMDRYGPRIQHLARTLLRDSARAEDAVQEIFVELWRSADRYDPTRAPEASYVTVVARRRLIDQLRSAGRGAAVEALEDRPIVAETDPGLESVELQDEAARALGTFDRLRPQQRELLERWILRGESHRQIADSTRLPLGTVKSHLRKALARVRDLLDVPQLEGAVS